MASIALTGCTSAGRSRLHAPHHWPKRRALGRKRNRVKAKAAFAGGLLLCVVTLSTALVGHDYRVDHMDHAVRLKHIRNSHQRSSTLLVLQHDVSAVVQGRPQLATLYRGQFRCAVPRLDLLLQV